MIRSLLAFALCVFGTGSFAGCAPGDLRPSLREDQRAELDTRVAAAPFATGNHWRATRGNQTIHVIATLHLPDSRMGAIVDRLRPIIASADLLMTEMTPDGHKALQREIATNRELAFLSTGPTLIDLMAPQDWDRVSAAAGARGIPSFMAAKFQPWYLALVLGIPPCAMAGIAAGEQGLDFLLMDVATEAQVPIAALEPYDAAIKLMAAAPIDEQIETLSVTIFDTAQAELATATLVAQYFEQKHVAAIETSRIAAREQTTIAPDAFDVLFDDFLDLLLTRRNLDWMQVINDSDATALVIAAGAGHLGGKYGLLNLLAQDGYALQQLPF